MVQQKIWYDPLLISLIVSLENDSQLKQWHDRCQKELPVPKQITPEEKATPPAAAAAASLPAPPKPKFISWFK